MRMRIEAPPTCKRCMEVLGRLPAAVLAHACALVLAFTIFLCYGLAVGYGHVPAFLPMISDCAVYPPEKYPFRLGFCWGAGLLAAQVVLVYCGKYRSRWCLALGLIASACVGVVGVVNEVECNPVHSGAAIFFFVCYDIYMIFMVLSDHTTSCASCALHAASIARVAFTIAVTVALVMVTLMHSQWDKYALYIAICEWVATFSIILFNWSFAVDLHSLYVAEISFTEKTDTLKRIRDKEKLLTASKKSMAVSLCHGAFADLSRCSSEFSILARHNHNPLSAPPPQTVQSGNGSLEARVYESVWIAPPTPFFGSLMPTADFYREMVAILGKTTFRTLLHLGAIEMAAVILTCYAIAVKEGHVPVWLPTISACGDHPPEKYIFTYGIVVGACLLFLESLCVYGANKPYSGSKLILVTSAVAAFCLGTVGTVCSICYGPVHDFTAVTFFILEDIYMALIITYSWGRLSTVSFSVKTVCAIGSTVCTILQLLIQYGHWQVFQDSNTPLAIVEWTNTAILIAFHWSFGLDFSGYYLAEIDTNTEQNWESHAQPQEVEEGEKKPLL